MGRSAGPWALVISLLSHGVMMVGAASAVRAERTPPAPLSAPPPRGETFAIEGLIDAPAGGDPGARQQPSPAEEPAPSDTVPAHQLPVAERRPDPPAPALPKPVQPTAQPKPPQPKPPQPKPAAPEPAQPKSEPAQPEPKATPPEPVSPNPRSREEERPAPQAGAEPPPSKPSPGGDEPSDGDAASGERTAGGRSDEEPGGGRRYGAEEGPRRGYQRVGKAFARAIPAAVNADPVWRELPLGAVGTFEIGIVIDARGKIAEVEGDEKLDGALATLVRRTLAALHGRFTLTDGGDEGADTLRITVRLEQRPPPEDDKLRMGTRPPNGGPPWTAYFTLASGRHFEADVEIVASKAK